MPAATRKANKVVAPKAKKPVKKIVKKKVRCTKGQTALLSMTPSHVVECADCTQEGSCQEGVRSRSLQIISIACGLRRVARGM